CGRTAQRLRQLDVLVEQRTDGIGVGGRLVGVACPCGQQETAPAAYAAVTVAAQFQPDAAEAATVVVLLMDEVTQVELGGGLAAGELDAALPVRVVEHQLIVAGAVETSGLDAGQGGRVGVRGAARTLAMPRGAVAAAEVALRTGALVAGLRIETGIGRGFTRTGRGRDAGFAVAVVQRTGDDGTVDVPVEKTHQHFLPNARQKLRTVARAGVTLHAAQPATGALF